MKSPISERRKLHTLHAVYICANDKENEIYAKCVQESFLFLSTPHPPSHDTALKRHLESCDEVSSALPRAVIRDGD